MTYSNARIVRGNDFKLQVTVMAPTDYVNGETVWDDFDLTSCSEIHVALICEKDQVVIPLEHEILAGTDNVLLCQVHGNYLHSGAAYGVEVKGIDRQGYAWRWKAKGKEMFSIVDNTSAQNLDDSLTPDIYDINARVGFEIHVDLSNYYTKDEVDVSQAVQDEAIIALEAKVDANEADIEAKMAAEIARAQAAEQANADAVDALSGSTEGSLTQLTARIAAEETRAQAAEDDLETAIDNEEARATAAEEALQASINAEAQAARQAEQANATAIANEATRAQGAESTLQGNIDAEATRAQAAEQANATAIANEITRAQGAESTLQGNIDAEATRAQGVESTLQGNIDTEATRAQGVEYSLQQSISTEATRAQGAESTLQANIDAEETRAKAAEQANTTAITNEATRAQLAEEDLQDQIDTLEAAAAGDFSALTQRIAAEENRAQAAEQAIEADVDALEIAMPLKANSADLATVATSGSYNDLSNKPTIPTVPTNVSAFTNDSGYLVAADIAGKADKSDTYTKEEVDDKIDDIIGGDINLQNYYTKSEVDASQAAQDTAIAAKAPQSTTYTKTEVNNLVSPKANSADLATVATSGSYNDLTDKPNIPAMQVQSDWNQTTTTEPDYIKNKPTIPTVPTNVSAFTNDSGYLVSSDIAGKADKADTYTKTEVDDIISQVEAGQGSSLANYYTKTQIDSQQAAQDAAIALKANSASLATVATSGDYDDLSNKPTIPTVPTNVSAFTNDAGYLTQHQSLDNYYTKTETDNKIDDKIDAYVEDNLYTATETNTLFQQKINAQHKLSSDLVDDTNKTNKFVTAEEKAAWNAKSDFSGSYNDLTNKPHIPNDQVQADWGQTGTSEVDYIKNKPTNVSAFTNDAGYLTQHQSLDNYYTKSQVDAFELEQNTAIAAKAPQATTYTKTEVDNLVSPKANSSDLATVATSGSYNDLLNKPHIPNDQVQADWGQTGTSEVDYIKNKPNLATVATSGSYNDLTNKPTEAPDVFIATYNVTTKAEFEAAIAANKRIYVKQQTENTLVFLPLVYNSGTVLNFGGMIIDRWYYVRYWFTGNDGAGAWEGLSQKMAQEKLSATNKLSAAYVDGLATVATSGDYDDLSNKPTIPTVPTNVSAFTNDAAYLNYTGAAQLFYDKTSADQLLALKANSADLATVATSGDYDDLSNKPTNVSDFTNDSGYLNYTGAAQLFYDKTSADQLLALKANSADLATVATSGSYNDLSNKPTIPNGMTFAVLPKKYSDGKISFDIAELHDGKLGQDYGHELANCADTEEAEEWWEDNGLAELYYSTDNGTNWTNYNMISYADAQNGPVKITLGTSGIYWKLYWWDALTNEIQSGVITGDTDISGKADISEVYTKSQSDDRYLVEYRSIYFPDFGTNTWAVNVGQDWGNTITIYGTEEYWDMANPLKFPEAHANNDYFVNLYGINDGDVIFFPNFLYKDTTSNPVNLKIWDDQGNLLQTFEVPQNTQANPHCLWTTYTFEDDYDYVTVGTDADVPVYGERIWVETKCSTNDLKDLMLTKNMITESLNNKLNSWDEHQADWTESDSDSKSYIQNKPNLATVATSGSYNDLTNKPSIPAAQVQADWGQSDSSEVDYIKNKPNLATVATSGSYSDLSNKPTIPTVPTNVSAFTNDAGYLTQHQSLANCVQSSTSGLKIEVVSAMPAQPLNNTLYVVQ